MFMRQSLFLLHARTISGATTFTSSGDMTSMNSSRNVQIRTLTRTSGKPTAPSPVIYMGLVSIAAGGIGHGSSKASAQQHE